MDIQLEDSLTSITDIAETPGYLKKESKQCVIKAVNSIREVFNKIMKEMKEKEKIIIELQKQQTSQRHVPIPTTAMTYSETVRRNMHKHEEKKGFQLVVKSKNQHSVEHMKSLIKTKINPTAMKIGISSFKALKNGNLIIETEHKEETEKMCKNINEVCGNELEPNPKKLRKPRLIIYNVPEDVELEKAKEIILNQNSELNLKEEDLIPKFTFHDKGNRKNLIVEVSPEARKIILATKLKIG
ncbi:hypothetical protein C0J52_02407 [Blattella germanica]|nr:hypothetical protein C0J52_02407 [Blattella germanica]